MDNVKVVLCIMNNVKGTNFQVIGVTSYYVIINSFNIKLVSIDPS